MHKNQQMKDFFDGVSGMDTLDVLYTREFKDIIEAIEQLPAAGGSKFSVKIERHSLSRSDELIIDVSCKKENGGKLVDRLRLCLAEKKEASLWRLNDDRHGATFRPILDETPDFAIVRRKMGAWFQEVAPETAARLLEISNQRPVPLSSNAVVPSLSMPKLGK